MTSPHLAVGSPLRRRAARAVALAVAAVVAFEVLALASTQIRSVRAQSPWQDDPANVAVSLTMLSVPVVLALVGVRALLGSATEPLPVGRARGQLRAATFSVLLAVLTLVAFLATVAVGERRSDWGTTTPWLVGGALLALAAGSAALRETRRTDRALGPSSAPDDWAADLVPLADLVGSRISWLGWVRPLARAVTQHLVDGPFGLRRHPVVWSVAAAEVGAGVALVGLVGVEGDSLRLVGPVVALVGGSGFAVVIVAANRFLQLVRVTPGRPRLRALWLGAATGLELAFAFRDQLWRLAGLGADVPGLGPAYAVMAAGAALGVLLTWARAA